MTEPSGHYVLLAGVLRDLRQNPPAAWQYDPNGAFIRSNGQGCTAIDPTDGVFAAARSYSADPALQIPPKVFCNLAADAVRRYSHAFGSKTHLIAALNAQHRYPSDLSLLRHATATAPAH